MQVQSGAFVMQEWQKTTPAHDPSEPTLVFLTVYSLDPCWNALCHPLGLGLYRTGIEIDGVEYTYNNDGHRAPDTSGVTAHLPLHEDLVAALVDLL